MTVRMKMSISYRLQCRKPKNLVTAREGRILFKAFKEYEPAAIVWWNTGLELALLKGNASTLDLDRCWRRNVSPEDVLPGHFGDETPSIVIVAPGYADDAEPEREAILARVDRLCDRMTGKGRSWEVRLSADARELLPDRRDKVDIAAFVEAGAAVYYARPIPIEWHGN